LSHQLFPTQANTCTAEEQLKKLQAVVKQQEVALERLGRAETDVHEKQGLNQELQTKLAKVQEELVTSQQQAQALQQQLDEARAQLTTATTQASASNQFAVEYDLLQTECKSKLADKDKIIKALKDEVAVLKSMLSEMENNTSNVPNKKQSGAGKALQPIQSASPVVPPQHRQVGG